MSFNTLIKCINEKNNPTVAGLDSALSYLPESYIDEEASKHDKGLKAAALAVLRFNTELIDAIYDIVPAIKPQSAYYEALGYHGIKTLAKTIKHAKKRGLYVIMDGKRNDIGSTCEGYADAYLGETKVLGESYRAFEADCLTVNPYLGYDGIEPFIKTGKSIFALVKTSNPSSDDIQNLQCADGLLYEQVARLVKQWGDETECKDGYNNVGAVVGATYPAELKQLRQMLPNTFLLIPGYGAQGGTAADIAPAFDANGGGAIVNASRSIMCAYKKAGKPAEQFAQYAREEAIRMRDELNLIRK